MAPATILSCVAVLFYVRYIYKDQLSKIHHDVELMAVPTSEEENNPEREEQRQNRIERDSSNENNEEGLVYDFLFSFWLLSLLFLPSN
jgi:hypothetical protein